MRTINFGKRSEVGREGIILDHAPLAKLLPLQVYSSVLVLVPRVLSSELEVLGRVRGSGSSEVAGGRGGRLVLRSLVGRRLLNELRCLRLLREEVSSQRLIYALLGQVDGGPGLLGVRLVEVDGLLRGVVLVLVALED